MTIPAADEPLSYDTHIRPLFRERDGASMTFAFDLWPCDGAWPEERVQTFERWILAGKPA